MVIILFLLGIKPQEMLFTILQLIRLQTQKKNYSGGLSYNTYDNKISLVIGMRL